MRGIIWWLGLVTVIVGLGLQPIEAQDSADSNSGTSVTKRVLLLGQGPDGHPASTHEYMAGMRILASLLQQSQGLQVAVERADEPWIDGPELLDSADAVVLFLSQGAKWLHQDPTRLAAFQRCAERGVGLAVIHWGMGTKEAEFIDGFVNLFGACHGGPDRKYKIVTEDVQIESGHPITRGLNEFRVREEFYYALKTVKPIDQITPLVRVPIEGELHMVGWAWERKDGGRSFGFSGGHYHDNWRLEEYRRLITQGILWTAKAPIPETGVSVDVPKKLLQLPKPVEQSAP